MVGSQTFLKLDNQFKQIFESQKPFGGISVICFGDFNQLRPVKESYIFETPSRIVYSILSGPLLWRLFKIYRLTEIMRQKDDMNFAYALNNLANSQLTAEDLILFNSRLFDKNDSRIPGDAIRLYSTNEEVDLYNTLAINNSPEKEYKVEALDFVPSGTSRLIRDRALFTVSLKSTQETHGLPRIITLKEGIKYMITTNIEVSDGLVNGSSGVLRSIQTRNNGEYVEMIWIEFDNELVGSKARSLYPAKKYSDKYLTPIHRVIKDIYTRAESRIVMVSRKMFPLTPSEALTIHKSQGQTYGEVVVNLGRGLDISSYYTAVSRARSSDGLFLIGSNLRIPKPRTINHPVVTEINRLENTSKLQFSLEFLVDKQLNENSIAVYYQNLPYLAKYRDFLLADHNVSSAQVLIFVENRMSDLYIDGFELFSQLVPGIKFPFGISIYMNTADESDLLYNSFTLEKNYIIKENNSHFEYLVAMVKDKIYIVVYSSPKFPKTNAIEELRRIIRDYIKTSDQKIIIIGDLNIDRNSNIGQQLVDNLYSIGLKTYVKSETPTNIYGNQIDYLFSSVEIRDSWVYETVVSDHKPILFIYDS